MRIALALVACMACATTHKAETSLAAASSSESKLSGTEQVQQTTQSGPETDLSLTFAEPPWSPSAAPPLAPRRAPVPIRLTGKPSDLAAILDALPHGALTGATLAQKGPASTQTSVNAQATTETHAEAKVDAKTETASTFKPKGLLGSLLGLWPILLAAGAAALIYFRKDALLSLIKRFIP